MAGVSQVGQGTAAATNPSNATLTSTDMNTPSSSGRVRWPIRTRIDVAEKQNAAAIPKKNPTSGDPSGHRVSFSCSQANVAGAQWSKYLKAQCPASAYTRASFPVAGPCSSMK